jgi:O-antigen ligase
MALCLLVITDGRQEKIKLIVLLVSVVGALGLAFPEALEQAWIRGGGLRPGIWQAYLKDVAQAPIFGRGIISAFSYDIDEYSFATAHNAYIQTLWHGGVIGLGLLLLLIASACWHAWRLGKEQGDYLVFSILLFTMAAMLTGVDTLVERPRDQWMLFWFPLALLISYQSTDRQLSRQHSGGRK